MGSQMQQQQNSGAQLALRPSGISSGWAARVASQTFLTPQKLAG